jgi:hypothetical protein
MTGGGLPLYVALLLCCPLLFGLAVVFGNYPSRLGWFGAVAGAGARVVDID